MITSFVRNYFVIGVVLFVTDWLLPNVSLGYTVGNGFSPTEFVDHLPTFLVTVLVLTILSMVVRPILQMLSAPINFMTLGLFSVVINVVLFWLATYLVADFSITPLAIGDLQLNTFFSYAAVAVVFGFLQGFLAMIF